jgi:hypothetical protein
VRRDVLRVDRNRKVVVRACAFWGACVALVSAAACSGGTDAVQSSSANSAGYVPATPGSMLPLPPGAGPRDKPPVVVKDAGDGKDSEGSTDASSTDASLATDARSQADAGPILDATGQ